VAYQNLAAALWRDLCSGYAGRISGLSVLIRIEIINVMHVFSAPTRNEMKHVFVSHAHEDERTTTAICDALNAEGICTWVSFRDIPSGANWDESIETALAQASAVVVIVSPSSVLSRYVRAEVEEAIRQQQTVIPVIIKVARLPLRWGTLQYVKWNSRNAAAAARQIARGLPHATATELREALNAGSRWNDVRELILRHTEWLPIEYYMAPIYTYRTDVPVLSGSRIDCFAARLDTIGPRAYLYYLGSPYHKPIYASGKPSANLRQLLNTIRLHCEFLRQNIPQTHRLSPMKLLRAELNGWRTEFRHYTRLKVHVIIGRRDHYGGAAKAAREAIVGKVNERLFPREAFFGCALEMMSYDQILDAIRR
jgi:hypothetical protein